MAANNAPVVRTTAGAIPTVVIHDASLADVLAGVSWDDKYRIQYSPRLGARYPSSFVPGCKVPLAVFVVRDVLGIPIDTSTHCVVPLNHIRGDVRASNLVVAPGEGKNYRAPKAFGPPPSIGLVFQGEPVSLLPRIVTMVANRNQTPFLVRLADGSVKVNATATTASAVFADGVVPLLESGWAAAHGGMALVDRSVDPAVLSDWRVGHAHYAALHQSYAAAVPQ